MTQASRRVVSPSPRSRQRGARRGFTMVELLVALAVAGLVVVAAYGAVRFATDATARLRSSSREALAGATVRLALDGWLHAASVLDGAVEFAGTSRGTEDLPQDELVVGLSDAGAHGAGPHRLRLWVDRDRGTPASGLVAELAPVRGGVLGVPDTLELAPDALGMRVRHLVRVDGRERWVESWASKRQLPIAVELRVVGSPRLVGAAPSAALPALFSVPLVVRLGWAGE